MRQVIFLVINNTMYLDEILSAFAKAKITGTTIIESTGMGQAILSDIPIFAGLRPRLEHTQPHNKTIFAVAEDEERVKILIKLIGEIINLDEPGTGIMFMLPITYFKSFKNFILRNGGTP